MSYHKHNLYIDSGYVVEILPIFFIETHPSRIFIALKFVLSWRKLASTKWETCIFEVKRTTSHHIFRHTEEIPLRLDTDVHIVVQPKRAQRCGSENKHIVVTAAMLLIVMLQRWKWQRLDSSSDSDETRTCTLVWQRWQLTVESQHSQLSPLAHKCAQ